MRGGATSTQEEELAEHKGEGLPAHEGEGLPAHKRRN